MHSMHEDASHPQAAPAQTLPELAQRLKQFAQARDWGQFHAPKNLASALIVEAGELLEHFQWMSEAQSRALSAEQKHAVSLEMADVLLYLLQLGNELGVDLMAAANEKLVINERKYPVDMAKGNSRKSRSSEED
jgi:dCTP diphosphatase